MDAVGQFMWLFEDCVCRGVEDYLTISGAARSCSISLRRHL